MDSLKQNMRFVEEIINGMSDWVRVIDRDDNMIFVNKAMAEALDSDPIGKKCYQVLGRSAPCENCISRKAVFEGISQEKEEYIGNRVFSVMSSPVRDENGNIIAVVEVLRDITHMKELQQKIIEQNKKLSAELRIAKNLQCNLLPKKLPEDKIRFSFIYKPCEDLGGDFLDIYMIDDSHTAVYIADVSGHGVPASMLTVFLRSSINKKLLSPAQVLSELYRDFNNSGLDPFLYITVFLAIIDHHTNAMTYSNAGLNVSPIVFGKDRFELLWVPGIPISTWVDEPDYKEKTLQLNKNDRIFFYTDGIIELKNSRDEQFGEKRLLEVLLQEEPDLDILLDRILSHASEFAGTRDYSDICDDITIALVEIR